MMNKTFLILILCATFDLFSQEENKSWMLYPNQIETNNEDSTEAVQQMPQIEKSTSKNNTTLIQDPRIDSLVNRSVAIDAKKGTINGYRIQLFFGSGAGSKSKAREVQTTYLQNNFRIPAYLIWDYPNFKVRVGDFRTKLEALNFVHIIHEQFPDAFIVRDQINLPKIN